VCDLTGYGLHKKQYALYSELFVNLCLGLVVTYLFCITSTSRDEYIFEYNEPKRQNCGDEGNTGTTCSLLVSCQGLAGIIGTTYLSTISGACEISSTSACALLSLLYIMLYSDVANEILSEGRPAICPASQPGYSLSERGLFSKIS
jgi:hypothetical protein